MSDIDYRKILIAYIDHVGHCEGVDFLPEQLDPINDKENAALFRAAAQGHCSDDHRKELHTAAANLDSAEVTPPPAPSIPAPPEPR